MSRKDNKYGIAKQNILVQGLSNIRSNDQRTALLGSVVKIENILANGNITVRFLDKTNAQFEEFVYHSKLSEIIPVAEKLWPLLIAMPSPLERVAVASNVSLCDQLVALRIGSNVEVLHSKVYYHAIVKYIGPVDAMGGGHYFGLELLSRTQITKCDGSYADRQYFSTLPGTGLFVSIDKLEPIITYLSTISTKHQTSYPSFTTLAQDVDIRVPEYHTTKEVKFDLPKEKPSRAVSQRLSIRPDNNEMDLIDIIGGSWPGVTDSSRLGNMNEPIVRTVRNKSMNPVSHLISSRKVIRVPPKSEVVKISTSTVSTTTESPELRPEDIEDHNSNTTYDTPAGDCSNLSVGTLVEVITDISDPLYGVIRWLGTDGLAGVELEEDHDHLPLVLTDGTHNGHRYFSCANGRGLFVPIKQCQRDSRFDDVPQAQLNSSKMFGQVDSPVVPGSVPPLSMPTEEDVLAVCGKYRGIQGHHNSCYLDATLFAMFTYTGVFDSLLFRPRAPNDIAHYEEVQRVLREEIVNPLRKNLYVRADRVMKLRTLLEDLSSVSGLTSEEKDPEEFLNSLLAQILKAEPFLKLNSGQEAFHYQLFVEKDEGLALPSVQQLFEQSFLSSDIKLKEVPSCLIIQMPRFGKSFKMYPRILPSQLLDVTDIIENSPRQCTVCGKLAQFECRECFGQCGVGLESTGFCAGCLDTAHCHIKRSSHQPKPLTVPQDFAIIAEHCPPPRLYMELFAVVCIETSHYVAFVKCGSGHEAPWCFFDSMADRKGEQNGYNIPEMVACPDVSNWLSDDGAASRYLHEANPHDKQLPEHARRLLCDAYICMYQSPDVMMYR